MIFSLRPEGMGEYTPEERHKRAVAVVHVGPDRMSL
jgi:hypothetical protein